MQMAACPSCGAEIVFASAAMPAKVCEFCRSVVMRVGEQFSRIGEAAMLPDDVSPLQIGTGVEVEEARFAIVGRMRWQWSGGAWNEWLGLGQDDTKIWLGEAMGRFMVLRECPYPSAVPDKPAFGMKVKIDGRAYEIMDVKSAVHRGAEGELPFAARSGSALLNIDLGREDGRCACLQTIGARRAAYVGHYSDLAALKPTFLRPLPGWPLPAFADV